MEGQTRRRRRVTRNRESLTLSDLENMKLEQLKQLCMERGVKCTSNSKLKCIARLLPYLKNVSFENSDTHEIAEYLNELGLSTLGVREEKLDRLQSYLTSQNASAITQGAPAYSEHEVAESCLTSQRDTITQETPDIEWEVTEDAVGCATPKKRKRDVLTPSTTPNHKVTVVEEVVSEPVLEIYNISLSEKDICSLEQRNELNDQIIDYRLIHLERNLACVHTMVLTTKETTLMTYDVARCAERIRKGDIVFEKKLILLPFCTQHHWVLFAICNLNSKDAFILYCDSLNNKVPNDLEKYIRSFLIQRASVENIEDYNDIGQVEIANFPLQTNNVDCGLYMLKFAEELIHAIKTSNHIQRIFTCNFLPSSIEQLRKEILDHIRGRKSSPGPEYTNTSASTVFKQTSVSNFQEKILALENPVDGLNNDHSFPSWTVVGKCYVTEVDSFRRNYPFTQGAFRSQGWRRCKYFEQSSVNQTLYNDNNGWLNPIITGKWIYECPSKHGKAVQVMYEHFICANILCTNSTEKRCTAKWMWQMPYKENPNVVIRCFGSHGNLWRPAPSLLRGLSVEQKLNALEQKSTYRNSTCHIATAFNVSSKQVQNFLDHQNRKKWLHEDHFEAFKLTLNRLNQKDEEFKVLFPTNSLELCSINNFAVLILSKNLIRYAVQNGKIFEIIGHDGVYKLSEQKVPINLYTTVTAKNFRGILLGISIASDNSQKTLEALIKCFLLYLRAEYPREYSQPHFSVDEELSQINALKSLKMRFNICRFHLVRSWKKHILKKVDLQYRGDIAAALLRLLATKNMEEYDEEYEHFKSVALECCPVFLDYYNEYHHHLAEYWNLSDRCLRNNSLGSTNNITESAIRLLEKDVTSKFRRFDALLDYVVTFMNDQLVKHMFSPHHKNETMKQMQERLESSKELYDNGLVNEMLESPFMFKVGNYGVNIQYCFCTCQDYFSKLRICKHINAAFIFFAVKQGMKDLPKVAYEFYDAIINKLEDYQRTFMFDNQLRGENVGRSSIVQSSARKYKWNKKDKSLNAFVKSSQYDISEIDRITGVSRDSLKRVFYKVKWSNGSEDDWVDALLIDGAQYMARQFLCELDEYLNSFSSGKIYSRNVYSIVKNNGKYFVEYFDDDAAIEVSQLNAVPCKLFLSCFTL